MDFQARQYDPQIGRFLAVDPLADAAGQQVWSPYAAMGNAPESNVDPNGTQSRNLTQADLSAADMLTYNRPVFFPTASLYMPGGALFKSGIGSIFDGKSWGGLTGSVLENYVNTHTTQAASIMGEVFETGEFVAAGNSFAQAQEERSLALANYEKAIREADLGTIVPLSTMVWYKPGDDDKKSPGDVDKSTVGRNLDGTNYIGSANPKTNSGEWDYSVRPKNKADLNALIHDKAYDKYNAAGVKSVLLNIRVLPSDGRFIAAQTKLTFSKGATTRERWEGFVSGNALGIAVMPKAVTIGAFVFSSGNPISLINLIK